MMGLATDANIFNGSALGQPIAHHAIHVTKGLSNAACFWLGNQQPLSQAPKEPRLAFICLKFFISAHTSTTAAHQRITIFQNG
jgi:hypothetical protein